MSVSKIQEAALTGIYSLVRKSGFLETPPGQWIFSRAYFLYKRHLEDPFHALAARHPDLFQGGHILDIGANIGYTSLVFARAIDPRFQVFAFEPEEFNLRLLDRLAQSPQAHGRIVPVHSAAGDRDGFIDLWRNPHHHGDHRVASNDVREMDAGRTAARVPILKIDTFVDQRGPMFPVRFIKIDVQGYELQVSKGMEHTLERNPGAGIALEYMPDAMRDFGVQPEELLGQFERRNYRVYLLERDGSLKPADADRLTARPYVDLLFSHQNYNP